MLNILSMSHADLDGVICSILINHYAQQKGFEFSKFPCTYRNILDVFKRFYDPKSFIFITDISFPDEKLIPNLDKMDNIFIIDHHPRETPSLIKKQRIFTDKGAGCKLVYDFLIEKKIYMNKCFENLVILGNDYDLWKHNYLMSKQLNRLFYYYGFRDFFERFRCGFDNVLLDTEKRFILLKKKEVEDILYKLKYDRLSDKTAFVVASHEIDEIADHLIKTLKYNYAIIFNQKSNTLSFRGSQNSQIDLGSFLKPLGGGGHEHAAGVLVKDDNDLGDIVERFMGLNKDN